VMEGLEQAPPMETLDGPPGAEMPPATATQAAEEAASDMPAVPDEMPPAGTP